MSAVELTIKAGIWCFYAAVAFLAALIVAYFLLDALDRQAELQAQADMREQSEFARSQIRKIPYIWKRGTQECVVRETDTRCIETERGVKQMIAYQ